MSLPLPFNTKYGLKSIDIKNLLLGLDLAGIYVLIVAFMAVQRVVLLNFLTVRNCYQLVSLTSWLAGWLAAAPSQPVPMLQYNLTPPRQKYLKVGICSQCGISVVPPNLGQYIYIGIFTASYHRTRELE
jgi:hypothetical protein